jgi:hypothetical protein
MWRLLKSGSSIAPTRTRFGNDSVVRRMRAECAILVKQDVVEVAHLGTSLEILSAKTIEIEDRWHRSEG